MKQFNSLIAKIKEYNPKADLELLKKAFNFAKKAHQDQKRLTGDAYITHPLAVAEILAEMRLDSITIAVSLLHDVLEDTKTSQEELVKVFGPQVAKLVDSVSKLRVEFPVAEQGYNVENLQKMFLAIAEDLRVVLIKLADRLHNMRTLGVRTKEDQKRVALETLEVFAPLSDRLGMGQLKVELEDLSFEYYLPKEFKEVKKLAGHKYKQLEKYVIKVKKAAEEILIKEKIKILTIDGRKKHLWSLYRKLKKYDSDINKIYDLIAIRIIVKNINDCYKALGIIHRTWKPLIGRIKDYIAVPKPNNYRSLHTTVFGPEGKIIEIQIRTKEMHEEVEMGIAAHWFYKKNKEKIVKVSDLDWVKELRDLKEGVVSKEEYKEALKIDLFCDRIFVFTPRGDVRNLPEGATPVDFAYEIHSELGNRCTGVRVNGKIAPLSSKLENLDVVEILISKTKTGPSRDWLNFVKTQKAKQRIRTWFRKIDKDTNIRSGQEILEEELRILGIKGIDSLSEDHWKRIFKKFPYKERDDVLAAIGEGVLTTGQVIGQMFKKEELVSRPLELKKKNKIDSQDLSRRIKGTEGMLIKLAKCCCPSFSDPIVGFITRGKGITIHKNKCKNIPKREKNRVLEVGWKDSKEDYLSYPVDIKIVGQNRVGLLRDISTYISECGINMINTQTKHHSNLSAIRTTLEIKDVRQLQQVFNKIKTLKDVKEIKRV